jgi:hypothetical protein
MIIVFMMMMMMMMMVMVMMIIAKVYDGIMKTETKQSQNFV